jgi:hypothetical protein
LRQLLAVAAALALMGVAAFLWVESSIYGASAAHPLGAWALVGGQLPEKGFDKQAVALDDELRRRLARAPGAGGDPTAGFLAGGLHRSRRYPHEYEEQLSGGNRSEVTVLRNRRGEALGVHARFWSGRDQIRERTCRAEAIAGTLWLEIAGARSQLVEKMRGSGRSARTSLQADFMPQVGSARGTWTKTYDTNSDARTIRDTATLWARWRGAWWFGVGGLVWACVGGQGAAAGVGRGLEGRACGWVARRDGRPRAWAHRWSAARSQTLDRPLALG